MASASGPDNVVAANRFVRLSIARDTGRFSIEWGKNASVRDAFGEVKLADGTTPKTYEFREHRIESEKFHDALGSGVKVTARHLDSDKPELRQTFWIYNGVGEVLVRLDLLDRSGKGTNFLVPVATEAPVALKHDGPLRSLFVPYDNDAYVRYSSDSWNQDSYEVGALYDDTSRNGLVVGSIDHDQWKSGVRFQRDGGMQAVAGVTNFKFTRDKEAHGTITGFDVHSPRFVIGRYADWRTGMERFGDLNAKVKPPLKWDGKVPFGWSSWSGHKSKVQAKDADAALEFVRDDLPWFRSGKTAYLNLDSFWDNLTREQRVAFVEKAHKAGLKAGIYWTPFVNWGEPDWKSVGQYHFRDMQLKDAKGVLLPKLDGGWPLDPTHPGTLQRIDENMTEFLAQGFDYIKLDFMTHGALEGQHYDPKITTGTEAYNLGMRRIVEDLSPQKVGKPVFIGLSIAPMFPHGYGHARRISCDIFSNIGASEYFLNSQNYGWWTGGRLYRFNDPDSACEYQALGEPSTTDPESRTRFTASVIGGGMMIEGDNLTDPAARERVKKIFSNKAALDLAAKTPAFLPVRGDTGDKAGDLFLYRESRDVAYVAAFNFDKKQTKHDSASLSRLGLTGDWNGEDLWTGRKEKFSGNVEVTLAPTDCALIRLVRAK